MIRRRFVLPIAFALLAAAAGWPGEYPLAVRDEAGSTLVLARRPERIVSLTLFTDELLLELVEPGRLLGVTVFAADPAVSNVASRAAAVPHKLELNTEVILSLRPDLVFAASWSSAEKVQFLRSAGVPVFLLGSGVTAGAIQEKIRTVAGLVGEPDKGRAVVEAMQARIAAVQKRVSALPPARRLSVLDFATWGSAQGRGSSWDEIVRLAGLRNAAGGLDADAWGQVPLSKEKLLELDPDLLVLPGWVYEEPRGGAELFYKQITGDPALKGLKAVRSGRVLRIPETLRSTTSQYLAAAVEYMARAAYPELFE